MFGIKIFDRLIGRNRKQMQLVELLSGQSPIFSQFGTNIYASDVVQQALSSIVFEIKKLNPQHIIQPDNDVIPINGNIQKLLIRPNEYMTKSDFLEKITWQLLLNYNSFVLPTYYTWTDKNTGEIKKMYTGLYPIQPSRVDFIEDSEGKLYVEFYFQNGEKFDPIPYSEIIHIKYRYSVNEFMGGDEAGQPNHQALLKTLSLNDTLLQGVAKAMKASFSVNGVVKYNTLIDEGKTERGLKELEKKLKNSESGFLPIDLKAEFIPLKHEIKLVDSDTLKFIDEKILRNWGVSLAILKGDYSKEQYEAFYQKTLEPIIISISDAFTAALFSNNQISRGNKIKFFPKNLVFMTMSEKLELVRLLGDSGTLFENEKREAFGMMPVPELVGVRMQSLNYINVDNAAEYQLGKNKENKNDDENTEEA